MIGKKLRSAVYAKGLSNFRVVNAFVVSARGELALFRNSSIGFTGKQRNNGMGNCARFVIQRTIIMYCHWWARNRALPFTR